MLSMIVFAIGVLSAYATLSLTLAGDGRTCRGPLVQYGPGGEYASSYPNLNQQLDLYA